MSLINQALKLEQQRRRQGNMPPAPMVARMSGRNRSNSLSLLLVGFTGMGLLLAASVTALLYFGADLGQGKETSMAATILHDPTTPEPIEQEPLVTPSEAAQAETPGLDDAASIASALTNLSEEQLNTVQKMLLERSRTEPEEPQSETANAVSADQLAAYQATVDAFSVQGIRKAGQDTRVFLDGKIRRVGDVVDVATGLKLLGFNEHALIFASPDGHRFEKPL